MNRYDVKLSAPGAELTATVEAADEGDAISKALKAIAAGATPLSASRSPEAAGKAAGGVRRAIESWLDPDPEAGA